MHQERYAIVGFGFRMPGGIASAEDFWRLLSTREFIREPVAGRYGLGYEPVGGESGPGRFGSAYEGLMRGDEPYLFDCHLFGVSAREAGVLDPQSRMLLTCAWEAFERAGWDLARLRNSRTGVFVGAQISASGNWRPPHGPNEFAATGTSLDMLPNRISYTFNLMGPSATYMTACSSGATALHAAVTALARGDCDQAVVGAATYLGSAIASAGFARLGVISPDGGCRSFDATANGYMRSEGVFVYLVKPLSAAEADGDRILAVIAGTAVNTAGAADGATGTGPGRMITAPTQHAQIALMRAACAQAGLFPREVDYLEAHATGTRVGDRIEGNAIGQLFGGPDRKTPLRIASVKSNVGHMEAAAFGCALLKVLLMFEHRTYAPLSRHFAVPNPDIDFTGLRVQTECEPFGDAPVVAGINSFGFGGANGHCLLTEYRPRRVLRYPALPVSPGAACMVPLSARSPEALRQTARELGEFLATAEAVAPEANLYTLAGNLATRRTHFATRTAFAATGLADLAAQLDALDDSTFATIGEGRGEPRVMMVFAGQGTQWAGCGRELYATEPVFRATVDAVDAAWRAEAGFSLRDECFGAPQDRLDECQLAQPVIFMIEVALTELLRSWGVRPACVVGHSAGEVAAAYAAGIYTLAEATRLIFHRAVQQQRTAGSGRMLAVGLDRAGTEQILRELGAPTLEIACENAPASTVACGSAADVALAVALLEQRGVQHRLLRGNVAFHSRAMDVIEEDLRSSLSFLDDLPMTAEVPLISSVTGEVTENLDAAYWWANVRRPVRFAAAIETAVRDFSPDVIVEVAPHSALAPSVRQCLDDQWLDASAAPPACVPTLTRGADSGLAFTQALAALYREGVPLDFAARYPRVRPVSHLLPPHPRDERMVMDPLADDTFFLRRGEYSAGPLLGRRVPGDRPRFEVRMSSADFPWLADHRVQGTSIMPAAGYIEMVLEALGGAPAHFAQVEFRKPCVLAGTPARLQTELEPEPGQPDAFSFRITSCSYAGGDDAGADESVLHCSGKVRRLPASPGAAGIDGLDRTRFTHARYGDRAAFYEQLTGVIGDYFQYGPHFQVIRGTLEDTRSKELLLDLRLGEGLWRDGQRAGYLFPPALLDGGLQSLLYHTMECSDISAVPRRMEDFTVDRLPTSARLVCHYVPPAADGLHERGQLALPLGEQVSGTVTLYDAATGERVAHLGTYVGSFANPRQDVLARSGHVIAWRPKFVDAPALGDAIDPAALIAALKARAGDPAVLRVAEFTQDAEPGEAALAKSLRDAGGRDDVEFWLLGASDEATQGLFETFGQARPAGSVRFAVADLAAPESVDFAAGLLREAACDLVVVDAAAVVMTQATWHVIRRLLVPGGLALVRHSDNQDAPAEAGWTWLRADDGAELYAAPTQFADDGPAEPEGPRWMIAEACGLADMWAWWMAPAAARVAMESLDSGWPWSAAAQEQMRGLRAIDFFCDQNHDRDPLGERLVARFLEFMRALLAAREGLDDTCRVTVVTQGAAFDTASPRAATLWGAVRALGHELDSGIDLRLADVGEPQDLTTLRWLTRHDVRERELAIRDARLYAPRLVTLAGHGEATAPAAEVGRYQLQVAAPGQISGLSLRSVPAAPEELGAREVEVDVAATALNFRDVMVALDMLPLASFERSALGRQIGIEASGVVRRTGAAVTSVKPGDPVVFMTGGCVASSVTVREEAVFAKPATLDMTQAAAALSVYVTAYYALVDLARLRPGQRVLIHSAMGGVGQAAIALARRAGATVYATAGTAAKRARLLELGVAAVFDSRSFGWYDELITATGGEGVDVVLNSLAGRHIALCLEALRPGGWHCEIGKVDIYANAALGMSVFRKNLRFAAIDVDRLMNDDPARARELTLDCLRLLGEGAVPPLPVTTYGYDRYADALRFMASGQHEGKIVLVAPDEAAKRRLPVADRRPFLDPEATYLVTGGFGGLGQHLVGYLVSAGARHLTLLDRDPSERRDADWVRNASGIARNFPGADVRIDIVRADVSSPAEVNQAVNGLTRPLKGVFHLAAVLDDHHLSDVTPESVAAVFAAKAGGARNLHQATLDAPLDHFVLLSSVASVIGNAGQSVYAAANAYLDGLAAYRKGRGLPALAFNMAALAEAGMAARQPHVLRLMRASGMPPVSVAVAIANLDTALRAGTRDGHLVCADIGQLHGGTGHPDFMRTGRWMAADAGVGGAAEGGLTAETIAAELCHQIARLSGHEHVGPGETIASFGVNSVSIAELSAFVRTRFGHHVGILDLMTTATPASIANAIVSGKAAQQAASRPGAAGETAVRGTRSDEKRTQAVADASLPAQCQEDLEFLWRTIRDLTSAQTAETLGTAVEPDRFRAVFLTGATGFVGRFVLAELLRQSAGLVVHCLVRAGSPAHGMDRIKAAMQAAEIWEDEFAARIRVWAGDIGEPRLGLAEEDFARLAGEVDAVYHLAADLNLISSYSAVRETNTRSFANVLELALTRRVKHLVYASTMGIFPQYFCNFAGEFAGLRVDDEATPDIALMRSVLPPGLTGYPWSKLVVEQGLLFARACGVPVAIMRLPQTGIAAATGYTQSTDIKVRIAAAVLDTGLAPAGFTTQWTEPVDTVSEILVRLSLTPERGHAIYHLVNPAPSTHGLALADFGLDIREVSYADFKRACLARGPRGPLHGHWPLIDHFADLWFPAAETDRPDEAADGDTERPIGVRSVAADLGTAAPRWPGLITTTGQSLSWIGRHAADWPYKRPSVTLDASSLTRQAREFASRLDVDFEQVYPPELLDGLDRLVSALRAPSARIREDRHGAISFELSRKLWNQASLGAEIARHPQIARERVDRPVFILGINRTGTTLLHRLLARGTRFWAPYPDEIVHPALPANALGRRRYADDLLEASGLLTAMRGIHALDLEEPEEEFGLLEDSFAAWTYTLRFYVPDYAQWLAQRGSGFAYRMHRQTMRHLTWQRGARLDEHSRQWLLKMPFHLAELPTLAAAYPDAVFIQTHRTPQEFLPSWLSLAESFRTLVADVGGARGRAALGAEQLEFMSGMLAGAAKLRSADPDLDRRFVDVSYLDLVADPVQTAADIYQQLGWTFDEQSRARMESWHAGQAATRRAERRHRYALADYGLTAEEVDDSFRGYTEFVAANKIRMR